MTIEDASARHHGRVREVTTLPDRGTVLLRSAGPPRVPAGRRVDVRPGAFATFDGDRFRMALTVTAGGERRRFERSDVAGIEDAVVSALGRGGPTESGGPGPSGPGSDERSANDRATGDGESDAVGRAERAVLRFGDRAACRRMLPDPSVDAIERRLEAAARRGAATLVTWTTGDAQPEDARTYDVVLDA